MRTGELAQKRESGTSAPGRLGIDQLGASSVHPNGALRLDGSCRRRLALTAGSFINHLTDMFPLVARETGATELEGQQRLRNSLHLDGV